MLVSIALRSLFRPDLAAFADFAAPAASAAFAAELKFAAMALRLREFIFRATLRKPVAAEL